MHHASEAYGFLRRFILEGVYDLRHRLRTMYGSDLFIGFGQIEQVAEELVKAFQAKGDSVAGIYLQKEVRLTPPARLWRY